MTEKSSVRVFDEDQIRENLLRILETAGKYRAEVVAATKTVPADIINFAGENGLHYMGENRVQELEEKLPSLRFDPDHIHFIGRLQTNKVRKIIGRVGLIHSLDSAALAAEISKRSVAAGIVTPCLVEINSGLEEAKGGVPAESAGAFIESVAALPGVSVTGLMSIGPYEENKDDYRPYFEKVASVFRELSDSGMLGTDPQLSMGMSDNYLLALEYGATMIRPGTAIFGKR
ncbi:MAG: YggS family pyridoxal phosphate-dependent enzyme [Clostridia bacterium]|nr:YggS family pyridoxal phosphate-dependent enzyme [Clostridia bacterium]